LQIYVADNPAMGLTHLIEGNEPTKKPKEYDEQAAKNAKSGGRNPQP
jgi:hypothetical protein